MLVRPKPEPETISLQNVMLVEPLELEVIASTVKEHDVIIVDMLLEDNFSKILKRECPDVVCFTGYITNVNTIKFYCMIVKNINKKIITIVGGVHCEIVPEDFNTPLIDYRIIRNATTTFSKLINGSKPNNVLKFNQTIKDIIIDDFNYYFPLPNRSLTKKYSGKYYYLFHNKVALIKTSFGCPFKCNFCFCRKISNYYERPLNEVFDELKCIKQNEVYIVDDNFLVSRKRLKDFFKGLKQMNIDKKYLIYGRADFIIKNVDLIKEFKSLGLRAVIVGIESFNEDDLKGYNKQNGLQTNIKCLQILNELDVDCYTTIILNPNWSIKDFDILRDYIKQLDIAYVNLQPLTPLPGVNFVSDDDLLIKRYEYEKWDLAHVMYQPNNMSVKEYYNQIIKTYGVLLFKPKSLLNYLKHSPLLCLKLLKGALIVRKQYIKKMRESYA